MTSTEQTQFDRFVDAGYPPDVAEKLVARGAWLEVAGETSAEDFEEVRRYREERDARDSQDAPIR